MIWLTGGALVTCLAMIVGLLIMVLYFGLPTFWPSPLVHFEEIDGRKTLGEVTRRESFVLTPESLPTLRDAERQVAEKLLQGNERVITRRQLVRTGNFEITGEHFRSVFDFAVKPGGESHPAWVMTVERTEWGRFYGTPVKFLVRHPRPITGEELAFQTIVQFVEANRARLPAEASETIEQSLAALQSRLQQLRQARVAEFLKSFAAEGNKELVLILADGGSVPWAERQSSMPVTELRETWTNPEAVWEKFVAYHDDIRERLDERRELEKYRIGNANDRLEEARLEVRRQVLRHKVQAEGIASELDSLSMTVNSIQLAAGEIDAVAGTARKYLESNSPLIPIVRRVVDQQQEEIQSQLRQSQDALREIDARTSELPAPVQRAVADYLAARAEADESISQVQQRITEITRENERYAMRMAIADGQEKDLALSEIVRAYPANRLTTRERFAVYGSRWLEYLGDEPREANSEGGVMPAIWGTVAMTLVMSLLVVPFGVLAALYLREYAKSGFIVSVLRIAISNLAGVPSIVFGVFGLGFFCYWTGAFIDGGPENAGVEPMAPASWWLLAAALAVCAFMAFTISMRLISAPRGDMRARRTRLGYLALILWLAAGSSAMVLVFTTPYFDGLFAASLPNPTFGKGGLLWASLTLALLTLPVVIVATEEALAAVPNSLREGSYACGAGKWQTIRRIVLPHAMPGIMTGMILAMARGAGEVAPLMLVGAVKLQPDLPIDGNFPFVHLQRSFMHLGFHIFDQGMQSQNSEAAKPMVFTTTLLLISLVAILNLTAIWVRSRLRQRFQMGQF